MSKPNRILLPVLIVALLGALWFCARLLDAGGSRGPLHLGGPEVQAAEADALGSGGSAEPEGGSTQDGREEVQLDPLAGLTEEEIAALAGAGEDEEGTHLFGTVVRTGGTPIEGALVVMRRGQPWLATPADVEEMSALHRPGPVHEATSDADGRFVLRDVAAGQASISIRADGFAPLSRMNMPVPEHTDYDLGRFQLETGIRVAGQVIDERGKGVEGVAVLAAISRDSGSIRLELPGHGVPLTQTDLEGRFEAASLAPGSWHLIFDHPSYRVVELKGLTEPAGRSELGQLVQLEPGLSIEGRVEGMDLSAEPSLRVTARRADKQSAGGADDVQGAERFRPRHAEVNPDGSFAVLGLAPSVSYKLRLYRPRELQPEDPEGLPERWNLVPGVEDVLEMAGAKQVVLTYRAEGSVTLTVLAAESRRPIENCLVRVTGNRLGGGGLLGEDDDPTDHFPGGKVVYEGLRPAEDGTEITVRVRAEGFEDYEKTGLLLRSNETVALGEVELKPAKVISVKVVDDDSGEPVHEVRVVVSRSADSGQLDKWAREGSPRVGASAKVRDALTDEHGIARLTVWPGSICALKAFADGYQTGEEGRSVPPHEEQPELRLTRGGRVVVRVVDGESRPVPGMFVQHRSLEKQAQNGRNRVFMNFAGGGGAENKTDEAGEVEFKNLAEGRHSFEVMEQPNAWGGGGESAGHEAQEDLYLATGADELLELRVAARGGYQAVLLESGTPLAGALARLTPEDGGNGRNSFGWFGGQQEDPRTRVSDHTGRVEFKSIKVGSYLLKISHPDRRMTVTRQVEIVADPLEQILDIGLACIEGRVVDEEGNPIRGVDLTVSTREGGRDYDGGDYRVRITEDAEGNANWDSDQVKPWSVATDRDGEYFLRGVRPEVLLQVRASDRYVVGKTESAGPLGSDEILSGFDFVLVRAGSVQIQVQGLQTRDRRRIDARLVQNLEGQGRRTRSARIRGWQKSSTLNSVHPGLWKVRLFVDGAKEPAREVEVEVVAEDTAEVVFQL